ncbi:MAG: L-fucose:H+ symporter permease [Bacteroidales bacterium]|jgi:FHS family L-fucose permease-like MFS transporter|nr:L-fucose:H+ symporter permease [Bacteroidales bacterium]
MENSTSAGKRRNLVSKGLLVPFILVTSLFFLWGFAHSLLDVLNKHFQEILGITKARSGWVQAALYGGYAIMAIPAGLIMSRIGYKKGIIFGLLLYAAGAFLFFPAAEIQTFEFTLFCLFVIACGLTCLETAANPYATVLGPKETSEQRLNLSQSFNGLGWIIGPAVGGWFIFSGGESAETNKFESMIIPYMIIGTLVLLVAVLFIFTKLPDVQEEGSSETGNTGKYSHLFRFHHFKFAVVTLFLYVAAQTGINSFFINYVTETMPQFSNEKAAYLLSLGFVFFMAGRFSGSIMMTWFRPNQMLALYALVNIAAMMLVILGLGWISLISIYITYFCMSIMFPTIFALGVKNLGCLTKKGSSILIMTVAGGAVCPMLMGWIADKSNMAAGFVVPLTCFAAVLMFALKFDAFGRNPCDYR